MVVSVGSVSSDISCLKVWISPLSSVWREIGTAGGHWHPFNAHPLPNRCWAEIHVSEPKSGRVRPDPMGWWRRALLWGQTYPGNIEMGTYHSCWGSGAAKHKASQEQGRGEGKKKRGKKPPSCFKQSCPGRFCYRATLFDPLHFSCQHYTLHCLWAPVS